MALLRANPLKKLMRAKKTGVVAPIARHETRRNTDAD